LTTVAQPTYELGRRAAEVLVDRLRGTGSKHPARVILKGKLLVRESSAARPIGNHRVAKPGRRPPRRAPA
ncbi:MAG: substrate-binding domain-containing protein, partial [Chloroflexi bacterium]|nr:substrate-binding domain-containing protein [Chloroflexota bacterium]